jgi:deoxyribonuclease IV
MLYTGPHVSISGSVALAVERAHSLGATGFAMFSKNQRMWKSPALKDEEINDFRNNMEKYGYSPSAVLPHAGYLINPATPDEELGKKSRELFMLEMERLSRLGLDVINIHPGAYKEGERKDGILRSAGMIDSVLEAFPSMRVAVENTAGAGTIIGSKFEELDEILSSIRNSDRVGFTLDTAHLYGAGYDVKNDINGILDSFFARFGNRLYGMHLNDSKVPLASNRDRHDNLGKGLIGIEPFREIVKRKEVQNIPLILETPDETLWESEIRELLNVQ